MCDRKCASPIHRLIIATLSVFLFGCAAQKSKGSIRFDPVYFDFLAAFPQAEIRPAPAASGGEPKVLIYEFVRRGQRRRAITTIADSEAKFNLPAIKPDSELQFHIAMPFNVGDGAEAKLLFAYGEKSDLLYRAYLDPARNAKHRDWIEVKVDLRPYTGIQGAMLFSAQGTTGELTADWIGWAEPKISNAGVRGQGLGVGGQGANIRAWMSGKVKETIFSFLPFIHFSYPTPDPRLPTPY